MKYTLGNWFPTCRCRHSGAGDGTGNKNSIQTKSPRKDAQRPRQPLSSLLNDILTCQYNVLFLYILLLFFILFFIWNADNVIYLQFNKYKINKLAITLLINRHHEFQKSKKRKRKKLKTDLKNACFALMTADTNSTSLCQTISLMITLTFLIRFHSALISKFKWDLCISSD